MHDLTSHHFTRVNGVRLHYVECGSGPLVVLLHGFPDFWHGWRNQISALAHAGFRVVAPDLRGYNLSSKPRGIFNYSLKVLSRDVVQLIHYLGAEKAVVAGHDWGGAIAWHMAMHHANAVEKLIVLNAPHPAMFARALRTPKQLLKSSYILFFQLPRLPEAMIRADDFKMLRAVFRFDPVRRGAFSQRDIALHVEAMAQPGALTAALNYYRALLRGAPKVLSGTRRIEVPTLLIWGERDRYLDVSLTRDLEQWVPNLRLRCFPNASHWVQHDEPQRVNAAMIEFLRGDGAGERKITERRWSSSPLPARAE